MASGRLLGHQPTLLRYICETKRFLFQLKQTFVVVAVVADGVGVLEVADGVSDTPGDMTGFSALALSISWNIFVNSLAQE